MGFPLLCLCFFMFYSVGMIYDIPGKPMNRIFVSMLYLELMPNVIVKQFHSNNLKLAFYPSSNFFLSWQLAATLKNNPSATILILQIFWYFLPSNLKFHSLLHMSCNVAIVMNCKIENNVSQLSQINLIPSE